MIRKSSGLLLLFAAVSLASQEKVLEMIEEFNREAALPLWSGFEPAKIPVAIFDGEYTYLYRHPSPPKEFAPLEGHPGMYVMAGRHAAMLADTSADIGGVHTATVMLGNRGKGMAPVMVHECFHVFEQQKHPSWTANEATLFTYPVDDAEGLALSRLELEALNRAQAGEPACWAARAGAIRRERFARLPADAVAYERGTELHEGTAQYIQGIAAGNKEVKVREFGPSGVRLRGYVQGELIGRILDATAPGWKTKVDKSLDELLPASGGEKCEFTAAEREAARSKARADVASLETQRVELRHMFDTQPGWRIEVHAGAAGPLQLKNFDPMNVERLSTSAILHKRMLQLGNDAGSLEILNHGSVTESAGQHPLFNGVKAWITSGLEARPEVRRDGDKISVTAQGVKLSFTGATLEEKQQTILLHLR